LRHRFQVAGGDDPSAAALKAPAVRASNHVDDIRNVKEGPSLAGALGAQASRQVADFPSAEGTLHAAPMDPYRL
jgi:hypothetical protein